MFDTGGQGRFNLAKNYIQGVDGVFLVYDCTDTVSFEQTTGWLKNIVDTAQEDVLLKLVANKVDMKEERIITQE